MRNCVRARIQERIRERIRKEWPNFDVGTFQTNAVCEILTINQDFFILTDLTLFLLTVEDINAKFRVARKYTRLLWN